MNKQKTTMNKQLTTLTLILLFLNTTQATELISVNVDGKGHQQTFFIASYAAKDYSMLSKTTPDGRYVAFTSGMDNLVPEGSGIATGDNKMNIFLRDREKQETIAISVPNADTGATELDGTTSDGVSISDDGRYIAFSSDAKNIVADYEFQKPNNWRFDIYYYDRLTKKSTLVSHSINPTSDDTKRSYDPSISGDGRYIAYVSERQDLTTTNSMEAIYLYDMATKTNTYIAAGKAPSISKDGRYITFKVSDYINDVNSRYQVYIFDRLTNTIKLVTKKAGTENEPTDPPGSYFPNVMAAGVKDNNDNTISDDGCFIAYHSFSTELVENDRDDAISDIFLYNQCTDTTTKITATGVDGQPANGNSDLAHISGNGRYIAFRSQASNLVENDTNASGNPSMYGEDFIIGDIFVYDQKTKKITRANVSDSGEQALLDSFSVHPSSITNNGSVTFASNARNLVPSADAKDGFDIYYSTPIDTEDETPIDGGGDQIPDGGDGSIPDGGDGSTPDGGDGSTPDGGDGSTPDGGDGSTTDGGNGNSNNIQSVPSSNWISLSFMVALICLFMRKKTGRFGR